MSSNDQNTNDRTPETPFVNEQPTPSQAEGGENPGKQPQPKTTPSQAEGDLETVEASLNDNNEK